MAQAVASAQGMHIERFVAEKGEGVKLWDFGSSRATMPVPAANGSYLTSFLAIMYLEGSDKEKIEGKFLPRMDGETIDHGGGWKFIAVEFAPSTTPLELSNKLVAARDKLLGR